MNELQLLLVLLVAFYLWECAQWIRRPGVVFRSWLGEAGRLNLPEGALSNRLGGFLFASPLPGAGYFFAVQWAPLLVTPDAIMAHPDPLDLRNESPPNPTNRLSLAQAGSITAKRHLLWLDEKQLAAAGSASAARAGAAFIRQLATTEPAAREQRIADWLRTTLDSPAVAGRLTTWRRHTGWLRLFCGLEFALVAGICGWLAAGLSLREVWPWFAGGLLLLNTLATVQFARAHRRLFPEALEERIQHTVMMALFPLATIRAVDVLSRPLLEGFHPLAVAAQLLKRNELEAFARRHLRRVRVWLRQAPPDARPFYQQLETALGEFLRSVGLEANQLLAPPPASEPVCQSYCPRCGSQFTFATGPCADCGTVAVEPVSTVG
jgi:hypothetical protein